MNTTDERIARIHERAKEIKTERSRRMVKVGSAVSAALGVILITVIGFLTNGAGGVPAGTVSDVGYAGASMLGSAAGGYILVALVAFMLGVIVTVLIRTYLDKNKH